MELIQDRQSAMPHFDNRPHCARSRMHGTGVGHHLSRGIGAMEQQHVGANDSCSFAFPISINQRE
jgi:hypothetical protein